MRIMLIFLGDITYHPLQGPAPKHGPAADWTRPHGAPRPTPFPAGSCQPHELLRAQLTPPEPPDFGGGGPSCPASAAAQPPLPPVSTRAAAGATLLLHSSPCLWRCPTGVFRGSELRFRLTIIGFIVSPNPVGQPPRGRLDSTPLPLWKGGSARRLRGAGRR